MATATRGRRRTTKPAAVEPVEELEDVEEIGDEEEDVEELELDEPEELEEEPAPKRRGRKPAAKAAPAKATKAPAKKAPARRAAPVVDEDEDEDTGPVYDSNWLAEYVNETCGTDYDSRALRMLLRKLAHAGTIQREVGTDRSRYTFPNGAKDPIVRAVVRAVKSGEVEEAKSAGIAKAQASKGAKAPAKKKAAAAAAPARRRRTRAVEVEDDEEDED